MISQPPSTAGWNFDNSYLTLPEIFYRRHDPVAVKDPQILLFNHRLAEDLGLDPNALNTARGAGYFSGNRLPDGASPLAQAYAGHQFGHFTMLGDGRAILLGEQMTPGNKRFDIQLKGSGQTPFSRRGDGRAALGPMLREYLISESMHALGIPTSRSLAVVATGEPVHRETLLPGAVLTRVAAGHLRVGTFEYAARYGTPAQLKLLADYTIKRHYPEAKLQSNPYLALLQTVIDRQAELVAQWLSVGFIHGVMNTDNVSIAGETIDYGPCAFMDAYNPQTVFSSIDHQGRYAFANQPHITQWNLARFAETLLPLLDQHPEAALEAARESIAAFSDIFQSYRLHHLRRKLGLTDKQDGDAKLIDDLLSILHRLRADYTNSFRDLALEPWPAGAMFRDEEFLSWNHLRQGRLKQEGRSAKEIKTLMDRHNPAVIPRNHRVEEALTAAVRDGDMTPLNHLLRILSDPYADPDGADQTYREPPTPSQRVYQTFCGT